MCKNSLKNVESDNNKIFYESLLDVLQRNGICFLNKHCKTLHPRTIVMELALMQENVFCSDVYRKAATSTRICRCILQIVQKNA